MFARCKKYLEKEDEYKTRNKKDETAREPKGDKAREAKLKRIDDKQRSSAPPQDYADLKDLTLITM